MIPEWILWVGAGVILTEIIYISLVKWKKEEIREDEELLGGLKAVSIFITVLSLVFIHMIIHEREFLLNVTKTVGIALAVVGLPILFFYLNYRLGLYLIKKKRGKK